MSKDVNRYQKQWTIGIPNGMLYCRYKTLWESFFSALGAKLIVSEPTNKELLQSGMEAAIDESCLSAKIYLGHVHALIGKCDYIFVPRISNWGRHRDMCTRFQSMYDLVTNTFRGTGQSFLGCDIDIMEKRTEEKAMLALAGELGASRKQAKEAYKTAKKKEAADWKARVKAQEKLYQADGLKVAVAAHSYVAEDAYFGKPILMYLEELGTIPVRADIVDRKEALKRSLQVSPTLKWEVNREIVGGLQIHRDKIDGIVLLTAFPCGPDSMVNEIVTREFSELPVMNLTLDSQNGTAGMETRLESFVDILKFKKGEL